MDKYEIAHVLEEIATLLEITGENPFKVQAYRTASRQLENFTKDFGKLVKEGHPGQSHYNKKLTW